jgi:hypothetical protein
MVFWPFEIDRRPGETFDLDFVLPPRLVSRFQILSFDNSPKDGPSLPPI